MKNDFLCIGELALKADQVRGSLFCIKGEKKGTQNHAKYVQQQKQKRQRESTAVVRVDRVGTIRRRVGARRCRWRSSQRGHRVTVAGRDLVPLKRVLAVHDRHGPAALRQIQHRGLSGHRWVLGSGRVEVRRLSARGGRVGARGPTVGHVADDQARVVHGPRVEAEGFDHGCNASQGDTQEHNVLDAGIHEGKDRHEHVDGGRQHGHHVRQEHVDALALRELDLAVGARSRVKDGLDKLHVARKVGDVHNQERDEAEPFVLLAHKDHGRIGHGISKDTEIARHVLGDAQGRARVQVHDTGNHHHQGGNTEVKHGLLGVGRRHELQPPKTAHGDQTVASAHQDIGGQSRERRENEQRRLGPLRERECDLKQRDGTEQHYAKETCLPELGVVAGKLLVDNEAGGDRQREANALHEQHKQLQARRAVGKVDKPLYAAVGDGSGGQAGHLLCSGIGRGR
ncbi:hypothetical protein BC828DRAFT_390308 [Blastocladiella britannica]|nr:hypothetical protein BC828DRAFT_390308 [Blastocladiella britannica]